MGQSNGVLGVEEGFWRCPLIEVSVYLSNLSEVSCPMYCIIYADIWILRMH